MNFFTVLTIILLILIALFKESKNDEISKKSINYSLYYKKDYIMTQAELKFYRELKKITDKLDLTIFPQVDLERIINVKNNNNAHRNRIKSRSIDYTIVSNKNCKIICCIELDDYTHNNTNRKIRDEFINELFYNVNLKLFRYNLNTNLEIIENDIKENLLK